MGPFAFLPWWASCAPSCLSLHSLRVRLCLRLCLTFSCHVPYTDTVESFQPGRQVRTLQSTSTVIVIHDIAQYHALSKYRTSMLFATGAWLGFSGLAWLELLVYS